MQTKPAEILVFDFLDAARSAADTNLDLTEEEKTLLAGITIHDTVYQNIKKGQNYGVRLGEPPSNFSPGPGGDFKEWDAEVPMAIFARVEGQEKTNRAASLQKVFDVSMLIAKLFYADDTLGDRICNSYLTRWTRGFDEMDGEPFAVANTSLIANPSGEINFNK